MVSQDAPKLEAFKNITFTYLCVCVCIGMHACEHVSELVWRSQVSLQPSFLSLRVGPRDDTHMIGLGTKCLSLLSLPQVTALITQLPRQEEHRKGRSIPEGFEELKAYPEHSE